MLFSDPLNGMLMWPLVVEVGDRIAQLILERIVNPDVMEVQVSFLACTDPIAGTVADTACRTSTRRFVVLVDLARPEDTPASLRKLSMLPILVSCLLLNVLFSVS